MIGTTIMNHRQYQIVTFPWVGEGVRGLQFWVYGLSFPQMIADGIQRRFLQLLVS